MHADAEVRFPAETAYVAVLRMVTAGIAARLDFTLDDLEDLKMAVSEASALVLADATPGGSLSARYFLDGDRISVEVSADAVDASPPDQDSFTWQVLNATASHVLAAATAGKLAIRLTVASSTTSTIS